MTFKEDNSFKPYFLRSGTRTKWLMHSTIGNVSGSYPISFCVPIGSAFLVTMLSSIQMLSKYLYFMTFVSNVGIDPINLYEHLCGGTKSIVWRGNRQGNKSIVPITDFLDIKIVVHLSLDPLFLIW